jgi:hypothetical protein
MAFSRDSRISSSWSDTTLHYITLHYITLHYTTLHYTTLHYPIKNKAYHFLFSISHLLDLILCLVTHCLFTFLSLSLCVCVCVRARVCVRACVCVCVCVCVWGWERRVSLFWLSYFSIAHFLLVLYKICPFYLSVVPIDNITVILAISLFHSLLPIYLDEIWSSRDGDRMLLWNVINLRYCTLSKPMTGEVTDYVEFASACFISASHWT